MISFNLINYAAGLTAISWWTFSWATGLGILPLTFLMVAGGDWPVVGRCRGLAVADRRRARRLAAVAGGAAAATAAAGVSRARPTPGPRRGARAWVLGSSWVEPENG